MKLIKYSFLALAIASLTSCLKSKNDFAGMREDPGSIVTSITEKQYINTDGQNLQLGYTTAYANFSFLAPATEEVKFFTLHVSQPRENKLSGNLVVKVSVTAIPGLTPFPAGSVAVGDITVPASSAASFDVPVKFTVNKAALDVDEHYGGTFTITSVSQGVFSDLEKSIDVALNLDPFYNESKYTARYVWTSTVEDAAKQYGITHNSRPVLFTEDAPNTMVATDIYSGSSALYANNLLTGANTAIFTPVFVLDNSGKVTAVLNGSGTGAVTNLALESGSPNQFTITSNAERKLEVKYSFTLTTTISGVSTPRKVVVTDSFTYDAMQVY